MDSRDSKIYNFILREIKDHGPMVKLKALALCVGASQLERIMSPPSKLIEHYGYITTQEEIDDRIKGSPTGLLLFGHNTGLNKDE